jgi:ATP-dependent Lon protease
MERVDLPGYTTLEKLTIATRHLVPKQMAEHGIEAGKLDIEDEAISELIHGYTREAGVRNLEREIAALCRAAAVKLAGGETQHVHMAVTEVPALLGPPKFSSDVAERKPEVGVVAGLAWTPTGGEVMFIETRTFPGKGEIRITGQLGDVMRESVQAAVSWVRSNAARLGIDHETIMAKDLHIHLPQGGVKKDGPSAGVALTCAVVSAFTGRTVRNDVAITGEIDLRGRAMPVGGIKEKVLAAHRAGMKMVLLPERNQKDALEIPVEVTNELELRYITRIDDAIGVVLGTTPIASEPAPAMPPPAAPSRHPAERLPS